MVFPKDGSTSSRGYRSKAKEVNLDDPELLESFNTKFLFILIKFFKFTSNFFFNMGVFLKQTKTSFLTVEELSLLIKLVRIKFNMLMSQFEGWPAPSNFRSIIKNLSRCYWKFYQNCVKQDFEALTALAEYIGVLDNIVSSSSRLLR